MPSANPDAVESSDAARRFSGRTFSHITTYDGELADGTHVYFRQGTPKPQGLQITIRVREPFGEDLIAGRGYLCINSGKCWFIPLADLRNWLEDKLRQQTVDVFLNQFRETLSSAGLRPITIGKYAAP